MLQQQRLHFCLQQKIALAQGKHSPLNKRIERKPLPVGGANGGVQIVVIKRLGICHGKLPTSLLKQLRPRRLDKAVVFAPPVCAIEQPVQVHLREPLSGHHRRRIAQNQQDRTRQFPLAIDQFRNQSVKNLNGRCFVPVNTR